MDRRALTLKAGLLLGLAASAAGAAQPYRIAVLGDSLTAGQGLPLEQAFPAVLEQALRRAGHDCTVIDAGVSGDTSAGGVARVDWVLADAPSHLIVELGANDGLRALPTDALERNLEAIVTAAEAQSIPVLLAGMLAPPNLGAAYTGAYKAVYTRVAERHSLPLYPFFLDGAIGVAGMMQPDGIHPNAAGVAEIVRRMLPHVDRWLSNSG
jgi:acyl-CoA thioesterase I